MILVLIGLGIGDDPLGLALALALVLGDELGTALLHGVEDVLAGAGRNAEAIHAHGGTSTPSWAEAQSPMSLLMVFSTSGSFRSEALVETKLPRL